MSADRVIVRRPAERVTVRVPKAGRAVVRPQTTPARVLMQAPPQRVQVPVQPQRVVMLARGPQGAPGRAGDDPAQGVDLAGPRYHYLRYAGWITRIDWSVTPSLVQRHITTDPLAAWPSRVGLVYA